MFPHPYKKTKQLSCLQYFFISITCLHAEPLSLAEVLLYVFFVQAVLLFEKNVSLQ